MLIVCLPMLRRRSCVRLLVTARPMEAIFFEHPLSNGTNICSRKSDRMFNMVVMPKLLKTNLLKTNLLPQNRWADFHETWYYLYHLGLQPMIISSNEDHRTTLTYLITRLSFELCFKWDYNTICPLFTVSNALTIIFCLGQL